MSKAESDSLPQKRVGVTVGKSPFNPVKLELVLGMILLALIWLVAERFIQELLWQFLVLIGAAMGVMGWLLLRTRSILRASRAIHEEDHGRTKQE